MPTRLVLTAVTLTVAAALPAAAAPVERGRAARVGFDVVRPDGLVQHVQLTATSGRLTLSVEQCEDGDCATPVGYEGALPGTFGVDDTEPVAHLRVTVAGRALAIDWAAGPSGGPAVVVGGLEGVGNDSPEDTVDVYEGTPAVVRVRLDGVGCDTAGQVGQQLRLTLPEGSTGGRRSLDHLRLTTGALVC